MASSIQDSSLFDSGAVEWRSHEAPLHSNTGSSIHLSGSAQNTATRETSPDYGYGMYGIAFTRDEVAVGQMFKITVTKTYMEESMIVGLKVVVGELAIGFTGENPAHSTLSQSNILQWEPGYEHLLRVHGMTAHYNSNELCRLRYVTSCASEGRAFAILLTRERYLYWFVDDVLRQVIHVPDFPLGKLMWGVVDISGNCYGIRAEIQTVSRYSTTYTKRLREMGLIKSPETTTIIVPRLVQRKESNSTLLQQVLEEHESLRQQIREKDEEIQRKDLELQRAKQTLSREKFSWNLERADLEKEVTQAQTEKSHTHSREHQLQQEKLQLQRELSQLQTENSRLQQQNEALQRRVTEAGQRQRSVTTENQQLTQQVATLRQQIRSQTTSLSATNRSPNSQEVEFWQVSPEEVTIREDKILGRGAWGYVAKGTFRGTSVAVKRVYPEILQLTTLERIRREIRTMAQIRHPNLVLFIAAVLNEQTGPMIVTELLDTSLRSAYQANRIGANKRKIFRDVSSALVYLHGQREPIIHRDVSSANVLLVSQPNDSWLAKLSDFGSANLARYATTPGEGAILYTAPEAYPHPPTSPTPRPPQTTKIDVYSFGVVACEVVTGVFPESDKFRDLLGSVGRVWPQIHPLITSCVSHSPQDRPIMDTVLSRIKQLDWEPWAHFN